MPMVPTSFVPSVTQTPSGDRPLSAPAVEPERNYAPQQIEQMGNAMSRAGAVALQTGQSMATRIQETVDDARTKQAEMGFLQTGLPVVTEYTQKLGNDAIEGYDSATKALAKAKQDAEATLTNPIQRRMFDMVATQHLLSMGKQMADHRHAEVVRYGSQSANDRADMQIQLAANQYDDWQRPDGDFAKYKQTAVNEALKAASLAGLPPDSPQAKTMVKGKLTALAQGVLTRMMDKEQYSEANEYYQKALADGEIDERTAEQLGKAVMEGNVINKGKNLGSEQGQMQLGAQSGAQQRLPIVPGGSITSTMGAVRPGGRTHDGIDIAVPVGTSVYAPADGTISKVWNDDKFGGGLSMEITYPNGYVEGVAHLSAANYKEGQKVSQGSIIALTGKSGDATGPVLHWAMKDPQGNWVDPRTVSQAPKDWSDFTDPDMLDNAIKGVEATDETERVKSVAINYLKSRYNTAREIKSQKYTEVKQQATDQWVNAGGDATKIRPDLWAQLRPSDQYDFKQGLPQKSDEATLLDLIMLPPNQLTPAYVKSKQPQLSQSDFLSWTERAVRLQNSPDTVRSVSLDRDQLNTTLLKNDLQKLVNPKPGSDDAAMTIQLRTHIDDEIDAAQRATGKELTRDQKQQIIDRNIMDQVHLPGWFFGLGGKDVMTEFATPEQLGRAVVRLDNGETVRIAQIPANVRQGIISRLQARNLQVTQKEIARQWVLAGKPGAVQ